MSARLTLLGLPAELRFQIYDLLFADAKVVLDRETFDLRDANNGILAVCRQLRVEASPLYRLELRIRTGTPLHRGCGKVPRIFKTSIVKLQVVDSDVHHPSSGKYCFPNLKQIIIIISPSANPRNQAPILVPYNDNFELIKICRSLKGGSHDMQMLRKAESRLESKSFCSAAISRGINVTCCFYNTRFSRGPGLNGALIGRMNYAYDLGKKTTEARHWIEPYGHQVECLTEGYCALCV